MNGNYRTLFLTLGLITLGVIINILANYASTPVPQVIVDHPYLIWYGIGAAIFLTLLLTRVQSNSNMKPIIRKENNIDNKSINNLKGHKADVFISYSSSDRDWVLNELKKKLISHGFKVITDTDFKGGSLAISEMADAIENTRHTIAVLTPEFVSSKWTKLETAMTQTLDPDASNRKLIPVLRKNCDIPLHIQALHYRDMQNNNGWEELIEDLM